MNILAVGAHYDDVELGCSGTLINHVRRGDKVTIVVVADSEYKNPKGDLVRPGQVALEEGRKAAEIIGAELVCLDFKTFEVPFDEKLTRDLIAVIEERKIDTVYGHWIHDAHRDHQYAGKSTLMAGRRVPRFLMYRSNHYDVPESFKGNFYSDISDVFETKIEVIRSHQSELERVRHTWIDFFARQNANDGQKIGVKYAECFEVVRYFI